MGKTIIVDCTLRDGLQAAGYSLDYGKRERILDLIISAGIREIEAGIPCSSQEEQRWLGEMQRKKGEDVLLLCWCRGKEEDLKAAGKTGIGRIHMAFPVSPILLDLYSKDSDFIIREARSLIRKARGNFSFISIGFMDALRGEESFLSDMYHMTREEKVDRVRISDTVGTAMPWQVDTIISSLACLGGPLLEFHGHNDLGMATANSLMAIRSGAGAVSCTLSGIGERAGNCRMEELISALGRTGESEGQPPLPHVIRAEEKFREISGFDPTLVRPLTGSRIFSHESGIHGQGLAKRADSYCALDPADFGKEHDYLYGDSSGRAMIERCLASRGYKLPGKELQAFLESIKKTARQRGRSLSGDELEKAFLARCS